MTVQMIQARNCILSQRNVRRTAADPARLETLKASVEARGVLQNLIGFAIPKKRGKFEITAGGRRLAAVHGLIEAKILSADYEIPVFVMNDTSAAAETSLAENFERAAMNPADECVAFRHFIEVEGSTVEEIAKRFGLTTRFVEGRVRLAGLADDVFEALRSGEIGLEVAQAFGTTTDVGRQARVYEQLKGGYNGITAIAVRRMMTDETVTGAHSLAKLVGRDDYLAAGGRLERDLFGDGTDEMWIDYAIVTSLAEAKMTEAAARIGGFRAVVPVLGNRPDWQATEALRPVYATPTPPTPEQQARLDQIVTELDVIEAETEEDGATEDSETRYEALQLEAETIERQPGQIAPEVRETATAYLVIGPDGTPTLHPTIYVEPTIRPAEARGGSTDVAVAGNTSLARPLRDELAVQRTQLLGLHIATDPGMAIDLAIFLTADCSGAAGYAAVAKLVPPTADILCLGSIFAKHGTTIDVRLIVFDKGRAAAIVRHTADSLNEVLQAVTSLPLRLPLSLPAPRVVVPLRPPLPSPGGLLRRAALARPLAPRPPQLDFAGADVRDVAYTPRDVPLPAADPVGIYVPYRVARIDFAEAAPHPTPLVESLAMASIVPPPPTYVPRLPRMAAAALSEAQLETLVYAGQSFERDLPGTYRVEKEGLTLVEYAEGTRATAFSSASLKRRGRGGSAWSTVAVPSAPCRWPPPRRPDPPIADAGSPASAFSHGGRR